MSRGAGPSAHAFEHGRERGVADLPGRCRIVVKGTGIRLAYSTSSMPDQPHICGIR